jgi:RNA polymerase sigma factor (sigma-70 family)
MHTMGDWELLQAYATQRSETAFAELVQRHVHWVYSAARRQVTDRPLAEDVTQAVFVLLARKAGRLRPGTSLTGWLFRTTRFVAQTALRAQRRRQRSEEVASAMSTADLTRSERDSPEEIWNQLAPHLDEAVAALSESDRSAILLRFYEQKSLREVGERLGLSEDAAKKRVTRALDKLRAFLTRRGVALGALGLAGLLTEQTVQAAPATLATGALQTALAGTSASLPQLVRETLDALRRARIRLVTGIAAVTVTGIIFATNAILKREDNPPPSSGVAAALRAADSVPTATPQSASVTGTPSEPVSNRFIDIHVVDQRTKQPLAGVEIGVERESQKTAGRTSEEGSYELLLPDKDPPRLSVTAHKDGFVPMRVDWNTHDGTFRLPSDFTLALEPGTSVGGVVQDERGMPIAGATVSVFLTSPWSDRSEEIRIDTRAFQKPVTDGFGRWRIDQAPADLTILGYSVRHPDYLGDAYPRYPDNVKPPDEKLRDMTAILQMKKGNSVEGAVLDQNGRPIRGAKVVEGQYAVNRGAKETKTDAAGYFRFANLPAETTPFTAQAEGYAPELMSMDVGAQKERLEFHLEKAKTIHGHVVDKDGHPIAGVLVAINMWRKLRVIEWRTTTGGDGTFEWSNAPADDVEFDFVKEGYQPVYLTALRASSEDLIITLKPPFIAHGVVTDAETGQPINSFRITVGRLFPDRAAPYWIERTKRSFSDGQYRWDMGSTDRFVLRAEAEGYDEEISPPSDPSSESFVHDFKLARAPWIQGVVRSPDGRPVANADVFLVTPGSQHSLAIENGRVVAPPENIRFHTADDGHFKFSPPGQTFAVVALHARGYAEATAQREGSSIDLTLTPWSRVEGILHIGGGVGAGETVELQRPSEFQDTQPYVSFSSRSTCDNNGHFLLEHVPAGDVIIGHWVCLHKQSLTFGMTSPRIRAQTKPGEASQVVLGGSGRTVVGRLVVSASVQQGFDSAYSHVSLHTKLPAQPTPPENFKTMTAEQRRAWVDSVSEKIQAFQQAVQTAEFYSLGVHPDGSFRVEEIPAGDYQLEATVSEPRTNATGIVQLPVARLRHDFTIPEIPDGHTEEPLDLADLQLEPVQPQP